MIKMILQALTQVTKWLAGVFGFSDRHDRPTQTCVQSKFSPTYVAQLEQDYPDLVAEGRLYLIQDGTGQVWLAILRCPCGCGSDIQLAMSASARPRWQFKGLLGAPTLVPSVWRKGGCRSHFFLRAGMVLWCADEMS